VGLATKVQKAIFSEIDFAEEKHEF